MPQITAFFAVFHQHFFMCQEVQIFVKKSRELHIVNCISHTFKELFSKVNYLYYILKYIVIELQTWKNILSEGLWLFSNVENETF